MSFPTSSGPQSQAPEAGLSEVPPSSRAPGPKWSSALPQGTTRVICVAGGRPGVGHSILTTNLGVYLAQLGRKVILVDADAECPCLHTMLDLELDGPAEAQARESDPWDEDLLEPVATQVQGLSLLPQRYLPGSTVPVRPGRKPRWAKGLRQLGADYILIDLGAGTTPAALELFLNSDFGICVTAPDPPSVEATYRFFRALFLRQLRRSLLKDRFRMRMLERVLSELPSLPSPIALIQTISKNDAALAELAASLLGTLKPCLVTNMTRLRQDMDLSRSLADMSSRYLGVRADDLGHIEQDDAIWLSVVRRRPLLIDNPTSKSGRNLERIARRVVAVATSREQVEPAPVEWREDVERSLYDVLWTHRGASDEELRRACKRQRELFQAGNLVLSSLLSEAEVARERARIEESQEILLDPIRRRAYDLSFFSDLDEEGEREPPSISDARELERKRLRDELARELHAETEYTGELLRRVRESQGIELTEISQKTKISPAHLLAIESEDFARLPAEVYTRGFVSQLSALLGLDSTQATRTYLKRYRAIRKGLSLDRD